MDNSAYEALMIGVNTFIFIVALTAGIMLMDKINDLVEFTKQETSVASAGSLIETYGETAERTFTGAEVYALYGQAKNGELPTGMKITVNLSGSKVNITNYGTRGLKYLNSIFVLEKATENNFVFRLKTN